MKLSILVDAGLTDSQAKTYIQLLENNPISPPALSDLTGETRSNTYKILEQLEEMNLAQKDESEKKIRYWALNPTALLKQIEKDREKSELKEKQLKAALPTLVTEFLRHNEQPGVKFYQGKSGVSELFHEQLSGAKNISYIRSIHDSKISDYNTMRALRDEYVKKGIHRRMFSPDSEDIPIDWLSRDKGRLITRINMEQDDYTAPVEWAVYGKKLSVISYGDEVMGLTIESPQIADAFKQILDLLEKELISRSNYHELPRLASKEIT